MKKNKQKIIQRAEKTQIRRKEGVTLIALVITIIVLLILARN